MRYYPLFLNLAQTQVLIVGAGEVGLRKTSDVLACSPRRVLLLDAVLPHSALPKNLRYAPALVYEQRKFVSEDITGSGLIFAATSSRTVNQEIAAMSARHGIMCNVADAPAEGSFIVPSHFNDGDFTLAISTNGGSPAMAKIIRRELQDWYDGRYKDLLRLLKKLRPLVLALGAPTPGNTELFRAIATSKLGPALGRGDTDEARRILLELLPPELHGKIEVLLHELS